MYRLDIVTKVKKTQKLKLLSKVLCEATRYLVRVFLHRVGKIINKIWKRYQTI